MKSVKDLNLSSIVNLDETPKTTRSEEKEFPEVKETGRGRPATSQNEVAFSFKFNEDNFSLLRAFCSVKQISMKETINKAIEEFLAKPENAEAIQEAKKLEKAIRKFKN